MQKFENLTFQSLNQNLLVPLAIMTHAWVQNVINQKLNYYPQIIFVSFFYKFSPFETFYTPQLLLLLQIYLTVVIWMAFSITGIVNKANNRKKSLLAFVIWTIVFGKSYMLVWYILFCVSSSRRAWNQISE